MGYENYKEPLTGEDMVEGKNAVMEAIKSGRTIDKLFVLKGMRDGYKIINEAKQHGITVVDAQRAKLEGMSVTGNHQGVIAICSHKEYVSIDDILNAADNKPHFILILDEITDPHNFGAIIRSCDGAGVDGIIIPKRRSAGVNAIVAKTSAGAYEYVPICKVANIAGAIEKLKEKGVWVYGADGEAENHIYNTDLKGNIAIVIGSEGFGISPLVKKRCDALISIPSFGKINSLNASVAAGIILFEALRQRMDK